MKPTQDADPFRKRLQLSAIITDRFRNPVPFEPIFKLAHATGSQSGTCNSGDVTQRPGERGYPRVPLERID